MPTKFKLRKKPELNQEEVQVQYVDIEINENTHPVLVEHLKNIANNQLNNQQDQHLDIVLFVNSRLPEKIKEFLETIIRKANLAEQHLINLRGDFGITPPENTFNTFFDKEGEKFCWTVEDLQGGDKKPVDEHIRVKSCLENISKGDYDGEIITLQENTDALKLLKILVTRSNNFSVRKSIITRTLDNQAIIDLCKNIVNPATSKADISEALGPNGLGITEEIIKATHILHPGKFAECQNIDDLAEAFFSENQWSWLRQELPPHQGNNDDALELLDNHGMVITQKIIELGTHANVATKMFDDGLQVLINLEKDQKDYETAYKNLGFGDNEERVKATFIKNKIKWLQSKLGINNPLLADSASWLQGFPVQLTTNSVGLLVNKETCTTHDQVNDLLGHINTIRKTTLNDNHLIERDDLEKAYEAVGSTREEGRKRFIELQFNWLVNTSFAENTKQDKDARNLLSGPDMQAIKSKIAFLDTNEAVTETISNSIITVLTPGKKKEDYDKAFENLGIKNDNERYKKHFVDQSIAFIKQKIPALDVLVHIKPIVLILRSYLEQECGILTAENLLNIRTEFERLASRYPSRPDFIAACTTIGMSKEEAREAFANNELSHFSGLSSFGWEIPNGKKRLLFNTYQPKIKKTLKNSGEADTHDKVLDKIQKNIKLLTENDKNFDDYYQALITIGVKEEKAKTDATKIFNDHKMAWLQSKHPDLLRDPNTDIYKAVLSKVQDKETFTHQHILDLNNHINTFLNANLNTNYHTLEKNYLGMGFNEEKARQLAEQQFSDIQFEWLKQQKFNSPLTGIRPQILRNMGLTEAQLKERLKSLNKHQDVTELRDMLAALNTSYPPKADLVKVFLHLNMLPAEAHKRFAELSFERIRGTLDSRKHRAVGINLTNNNHVDAIKEILKNKNDNVGVDEFVNKLTNEDDNYGSVQDYIAAWGFNNASENKIVLFEDDSNEGDDNAPSNVWALAKTIFAHKQYQLLLTQFNATPLAKKILIDHKTGIIDSISINCVDKTEVNYHTVAKINVLLGQGKDKQEYDNVFKQLGITDVNYLTDHFVDQTIAYFKQQIPDFFKYGHLKESTLRSYLATEQGQEANVTDLLDILKPLANEFPTKDELIAAAKAVNISGYQKIAEDYFTTNEYKWLQKQKFGNYLTADVPKATLDYIHPDKDTAHEVIKKAIGQCEDHDGVKKIHEALNNLAHGYSSALKAFAPLKAMGKLYPEAKDKASVDHIDALALILAEGAKDPQGVVAFLTKLFVTPASDKGILAKAAFADELGLTVGTHDQAINFLYGCYLQNQLAKDQTNVQDIKRDLNNQWLTQFKYELTGKTINLLNLESDEGIAFARSLGSSNDLNALETKFTDILNSANKGALEVYCGYQDNNPNPINQAAARLASEIFCKKVDDAINAKSEEGEKLRAALEKIKKAPNGEDIIKRFWYQVRFDDNIQSVDEATDWLTNLASPDPTICTKAVEQIRDFSQKVFAGPNIPSEHSEVGQKYGDVYQLFPFVSPGSLASHNLLQEWLDPEKNTHSVEYPAIALVLKTNSKDLAELRLKEPENTVVKSKNLNSPERKQAILEGLIDSEPKTILDVIYEISVDQKTLIGQGHPSYDDYQRYLIAYGFPGKRRDYLTSTGLLRNPLASSTGTLTKQLAAASYADRLVNALKEAAENNEPEEIRRLLRVAFELHGQTVPLINDEELNLLLTKLTDPLFYQALSQMFATALVNDTLNVLVSKDVFEKKGAFSLLNPTPLMLERFDKLMDPHLTHKSLSLLMQKMGFDEKDADSLAREHFGRVQWAEFNQRFTSDAKSTTDRTTKDKSVRHIFNALCQKASIPRTRRAALITNFMQANGILASELGDLLLAKDLNLQTFTTVIEAIVGKNKLAPKEREQLFEKAKRLGNFELIHNKELRENLHLEFVQEVFNPKRKNATKTHLPDRGAAGNYALEPDIEKQIQLLNELEYSETPTAKEDKVNVTLNKVINTLTKAGMEIPEDIAKQESSTSKYVVKENFITDFNDAQKDSYAFRLALGIVNIDDKGVPVPLPLDQRSPGVNQFLNIARTHQWELSQDILDQDFPRKPPDSTSVELSDKTDKYQFLAKLNELKSRLQSGKLEPSGIVSKPPITDSYDDYVNQAKKLTFDELLAEIIDDYANNKITRHEKRILMLGEHASTLREDKGLRKILETMREKHHTDSISLIPELTYYKGVGSNPNFDLNTETNLDTCLEIQTGLVKLKQQLHDRRYQCRQDFNVYQDLGPETKSGLSQKQYQDRKKHWQQIDDQYQAQLDLLDEAEKAINDKVNSLQDLKSKGQLITREDSWFTDNLLAVFGEEEGNPLTNPEMRKNMIDKMTGKDGLSVKVSFSLSGATLGDRYSSHLTTGRHSTTEEKEELQTKKNPLIAFLPCKGDNNTVCFTNKSKVSVSLFSLTGKQKGPFWNMTYAKQNIEALLSIFHTLNSGSQDFTIHNVKDKRMVALWRALYRHMFSTTQNPPGNGGFDDPKVLKEIDNTCADYLKAMPKLLAPYDVKIETTYLVKGKEKKSTITGAEVKQNFSGGINTITKHGQEDEKDKQQLKQENTRIKLGKR